MGVLAQEIEATYEVLSKMGEGGMGAVYKVRHRFFDEIRVIKVMQAELEPLPELKERFLGEAKRGKQLRHPNLAEVIDFSIAADGTSYIVMEYIEGVNLREVLTRTGAPLDYRVVVPIAEQALAALGFLHEKKFVHRDISPDNFMMIREGDEDPRVKLIDLGIAKSLDATRQLTMAGTFLGKLQYAAPEQFGGQVDGRSDLYSLGIVLYELLTGAKPITGSNPMSLIGAQMSKPPRSFAETDPNGRVPRQIQQAVLKALEKKPEDRYQTAAEFSAALHAAVPTAQRRTLPLPVVTVAKDDPPASPALQAARPAPVEDVTVRSSQLSLPAVVTAPAAHGSDSPSRPRWPMIAAGIALVLLVVLIAVRMKLKNDAAAPPATQTTASNTMAGSSIVVPAAPAVTGKLFINALPWGEVTSVIDAAGVDHLRGGRTETPLLLELPPGTYKVSLTNPNSNRSVVRDATVTANVTSRCVAELDRIDAEGYVDGIGLGR